MKIYTRTGDMGETSLFGGGRVSKNSVRVGAYGDVDELNACVGLAVTMGLVGSTPERLATVQGDLMTLGSHLATPQPEPPRKRPILPPLPVGRISEMEEWIDELWEELPPLQNFVLPGGVPGAATLHLARVVCRRAERSVVRLSGEEDVEESIIQYLNRLSDLLFAMARLENERAGKGDVLWSPAQVGEESESGEEGE
jgi:cob(I)alamin adenosyltransferase